MKRNIFIVITMTLLLAVLSTGCTSTTPTSAPTSTPVPTSGAEYTLPIVEPGSVTLTISTFDNWYVQASYKTGLPVWKEIEKRTGITIEWDVLPDSEYGASIGTKMAAGVGLPDIVNDYNGSSDAYKYGTEGILIPLKTLIKDHAPNITKYFDGEGAVVRKLLTTPEGEIYSLATSRLQTTSFDPWNLIVRKDWLDKLSLQAPTNIAEWTNVLEKFKNDDPNGNGKKDEIPVVFYPDEFIYSAFGLWGSAWGLHIDGFSDGIYADAAGKVQYEWIDPKTKEVVSFLSKLYADGIFDLEYATRDYDSMQALINQGLVGVTSEWTNFISQSSAVDAIKQAGWPNAEYIAAQPPSGTDGYKGHLCRRGPTGGHWSITRDCKYPVVAIQLLDYIYASEEGIRLMNYGLEGQSYTLVAGKPMFSDFVKKNSTLGWRDALMSIGALPNVPYILQASIYADINSDNKKLIDTIAMEQPYLIDPFPNVMPTADEATQLEALMTDITTYRDEMINKFVMGQASLDKWDEFVAQIRTLKIDDVLKIKQAQYDRFVNQ